MIIADYLAVFNPSLFRPYIPRGEQSLLKTASRPTRGELANLSRHLRTLRQLAPTRGLKNVTELHIG